MTLSFPYGYGRTALSLALVAVAACSSSPGGDIPAPSASAATTASAPAPIKSSSPPFTHPKVPGGPHGSASASAAPVSSGPPAGAALAEIHVPAGLADGERVPFVLYLHGLGVTGEGLRKALGVDAFAASKKFAFATPDGQKNAKGQQFWNASRACCNFDNTNVDHVAELGALLTKARAMPQIDPARVYIIGFSNGGFMAHRLACELDGISGIASVAGAGPLPDVTCNARPVTVLQVHGDADDIIRYQGGIALSKTGLPPHPSARATMKAWATREHCNPLPGTGGSIDLEPKLPEEETDVLRYSGCDRPVELWTVKGGSHYIGTGSTAQGLIYSFLDGKSRR